MIWLRPPQLRLLTDFMPDRCPVGHGSAHTPGLAIEFVTGQMQRVDVTSIATIGILARRVLLRSAANDLGPLMLILHDYRPSQNAWKIRVLLGLLTIPYETREVSIFEGEGQLDAFLKLNPTGAVPVLQLEDGRAIAESNAIMEYLADSSAFLPSDRYFRAKVGQWLCFEQYHIEPVIGSLRFWTLTGRLKRNAAIVPAKREAAVKTLTALERGLAGSPWLAGERLTIADLSVYAYTHLAGDCEINLSTYPAVNDWLARVGEAIGAGFQVYPYTVDPHSQVFD